MILIRKILIFLVFCLFAKGIVFADTLPSAESNTQRLQESIEMQEKQKEAEQSYKNYEENKNKIIKQRELTDEDKQKNIILNRIDFSPSDILSEKIFNKIKDKYEGKKISVEDIYSILNTINNEYMLRGYIAAKAFLQEQDISEGVLFISLVEGKVKEMKIENNKHTSENYIKRTILFKGYDIVDVNKMQKDILKFNAGNDAKARISLEPGPVYGTTNVNVVMDEPQTVSASVFIDNAGQEETGVIRYGSYLVVRSLTKYRDILNVGGLMTQAGGSHSLYGSYEIPEPFLGTRIGIGADYSDTEITSGSLHSLNVKGDFYDVYLYSKKPFNVKPATVSNFMFTISTKRGSNYISSFRTQDNKTDTLAVSVDNLMLFNGGYLFNYASITNGLTLIEGKDYFMRYTYQGNLYKTLFKNTGFDFKLKAQYADGTTVPSGSKMQIGGVNTVRGYREGMLSANSGVNAMTELQYDCSDFLFPKVLDYTKFFMFFDYGYIIPNSEENIPDNYRKDIYSAGLGFRFSLLKHLEGNLTVGRTFVEHPYFENDETKLMFFVQGKI